MILRERIEINATAEQVWSVLSDPGRMSEWNPHCVRCEADEDTMRVGLHFRATMRFHGGPERQVDCEVIACEPARILALRFSGAAPGGAGEYVEETYGFQSTAEGTELLHQVDFSYSGLPWFLRIVLKVIHLLGQSHGPSPLDVLKELAEGTPR